MYEKIKADIITAMKEKEQLKVQTLRGIKGDIDLEHINKKIEITDEVVMDIIIRHIKTRKESIVEFEKGNRKDLVDKTLSEIAMIEPYLPASLTEEELNNILSEVFNKVNPTSSKDMGLIMREITPLIKGKADMKMVSELIKHKLNNL